MQHRICLIYNYAQHYRKGIFTLLDKNIPIDFVFGDKYLDIKKMDYSLLDNFKKEVKNITFIKKPLYWQKGVIKLAFDKNYKGYLILGDLMCVSTWIFIFLCKLSGKKVYMWTHGWYGKESKLKVFLKKIFFYFADHIFLYGNYAKKLMIDHGFNKNKLHVIYNSLDYQKHLELREKSLESDIFSKHFQNNNKNLIFVGRLTKSKKIDLIIKLIAELQKKGHFFNLSIIGDGEVRNELEALVKDLKTDNSVWFYGDCYEEEKLSELIFNADLCVSPGNVGLTAIHSMSFGTPVISHNNFAYQRPEFEAIVPGETGDFFEENNMDNLANVIIEWFDKLNNRESVRKKCYDVVDNYYNPFTQLKIFENVISNSFKKK